MQDQASDSNDVKMYSDFKSPYAYLAFDPGMALEAERIPCAPVLTLHEAIAHPHLRERGTVRRVKDRLIGEFDIPGMPVKFSHWPGPTTIEADLLGEHNEHVLRELLALSDADIATLYADQVLVRDPLLDAPSA